MISRFCRLFIAALILCALNSAYASNFQEGKHYSLLMKPIKDAPDVVEFFSFYCRPCFMFSETYHIDGVIKKSISSDVKLTKYHVGLMGPLGNELTEAWSVAMVLGIESEIEKNLFTEMQIGHAVNDVSDIKRIFSNVGIDAVTYDKTKESPEAKALTQRQNDAVRLYGVTATPTLYVLGKYKIINTAMASKSVESYAQGYASLISQLLIAK